MNQVRPLLEQAIGPHCFSTFFEKFDVLNVPCLKSSLVVGLNFGIVAGALLYKIPQILKILQGRSVEGLSLTANFLDYVMFTASAVYALLHGWTFGQYGESVFAGIATAVILLMFPMFAKVKPTALFYLLFAVYNAVLVAGFLGHVPLHYVDWAYASTTALVIASRGSQILAIFGNRATGALSFLTTFLQFAGTAARTWTLINGGRSVADWAVVAIACGLNGIILLSFAVFPSKKKAKGKRE